MLGSYLQPAAKEDKNIKQPYWELFQMSRAEYLQDQRIASIPPYPWFLENFSTFNTDTLKDYFSDRPIKFDDEDTVDLILQIASMFNSNQIPDEDVFLKKDEMA